MLDKTQKRAIANLREAAKYLAQSTTELNAIVYDYNRACQNFNRQIFESCDKRIMEWLPEIQESLDWLTFLASSVQVTAAERVIDLYRAGTPVGILKIRKAQTEKEARKC